MTLITVDFKYKFDKKNPAELIASEATQKKITKKISDLYNAVSTILDEHNKPVYLKIIFGKEARFVTNADIKNLGEVLEKEGFFVLEVEKKRGEDASHLHVFLK